MSARNNFSDRINFSLQHQLERRNLGRDEDDDTSPPEKSKAESALHGFASLFQEESPEETVRTSAYKSPKETWVLPVLDLAINLTHDLFAGGWTVVKGLSLKKAEN